MTKQMLKGIRDKSKQELTERISLVLKRSMPVNGLISRTK